MKIKTQDLTGAALDWAVTSIEEPSALRYGIDDWREQRKYTELNGEFVHRYHQSWAQAGPIIEREEIFLAKSILGGWTASIYYDASDDEEYPRHRCTLHGGETPLVAAMRCFVASRLGDEVDVPEELRE